MFRSIVYSGTVSYHPTWLVPRVIIEIYKYLQVIRDGTRIFSQPERFQMRQIFQVADFIQVFYFVFPYVEFPKILTVLNIGKTGDFVDAEK